MWHRHSCLCCRVSEFHCAFGISITMPSPYNARNSSALAA